MTSEQRGQKAREQRGQKARETAGRNAREDAAGYDDEDPLEAARAIALRSLAAAPRTRAQLAEKLADKGVAGDVAETLLDRLAAVGLIDDAELADRFVRTRHAERHQGRRAIALELRRKGIEDEVAARALDQLGDEDEESAALEVARARLRATRRLDPAVRYRRTAAALGRKGFSGDVARRAMRTALDEEEIDIEDGAGAGDLDAD
ncbi:regulatory protein RecX [Georgenia sp. Z1344]|uniref:regulatory protein RecX n=1 Tax=Georgenia sp. Z1344 TaxID=3416706 RepID=UPI003CEFD75D